ncbi:hypothetical protein MMP65_06055 [Acinetobacter sp. ANC 3926]|uniref:hypothetical protein n=1 Tax=Acinetobacter genomosp. 15BJ TaxID=106651 RepID=UPI001F4AFEBB|nr:hypothetical protein [Acinetobacter genomosp. 15BJ]MCH7291024.1 hypothetical protein [Acinetobacter genomosp. 15BJ]
MATVIQIKNADFSGKGFPVITPLYAEGILGAFRPHKSLQDSSDLSGKGSTINIIGNPIFRETYVECDTANGLVTNITEKSSMTYAFVSRTKSVGGNFQSFLGGSYTGGRGLSMYRTNVGVSSQTFAKRTTDNTYQNETKRIANTSLDTSELTKWGFWLVSIDAVNNKVRAFNSEFGFIDLTTAERNYADRDGLSRSLYIGKPSYTSEATYPAKTHVAEALFYGKALSDDEILRVLDVSRKAMALRQIYF